MPKPQAQLRVSAIPKQTCPKCAQPMRFAAIMPHASFDNLESCMFQCECGETLTVTVAAE
jgi:hypothetical protein